MRVNNSLKGCALDFMTHLVAPAQACWWGLTRLRVTPVLLLYESLHPTSRRAGPPFVRVLRLGSVRTVFLLLLAVAVAVAVAAVTASVPPPDWGGVVVAWLSSSCLCGAYSARF